LLSWGTADSLTPPYTNSANFSAIIGFAKKGSLLLGATFILQDLQLLAYFHALANDVL
jgi:hypothetical protein